jgi:hypothetical protein
LYFVGICRELDAGIEDYTHIPFPPSIYRHCRTVNFGLFNIDLSLIGIIIVHLINEAAIIICGEDEN